MTETDSGDRAELRENDDKIMDLWIVWCMQMILFPSYAYIHMPWSGDVTQFIAASGKVISQVTSNIVLIYAGSLVFHHDQVEKAFNKITMPLLEKTNSNVHAFTKLHYEELRKWGRVPFDIHNQ